MKSKPKISSDFFDRGKKKKANSKGFQKSESGKNMDPKFDISESEMFPKGRLNPKAKANDKGFQKSGNMFKKKTLEYRPERDKTERKTMEYRPERDSGSVEYLKKGGSVGKMKKSMPSVKSKSSKKK